ncbi:MAG: recombinase family protein [Steroidobacteraceae bacterium]|jgi:DNA invertase Pin-like site-specific DNA recombinase
MSPAKPKFISYHRVSTDKQGRSGLGLEAQQATVKQYLASHGGVELAAYVEVESGKVDARPQLEAALLHCRQTRSTLLISKLDRLSRNVAFLFRLRDEGVKFQAIDIPDCNSLTLCVFAGMAQHEREIISQRTKAALMARRARGLPLGTPRDLSAYAASAGAKGRAALLGKVQKHALDMAPQIERARGEGACTTLRCIARWLNDQGFVTLRGKQWTPAAVLNVEHRLRAA